MNIQKKEQTSHLPTLTGPYQYDIRAFNSFLDEHDLIVNYESISAYFHHVKEKAPESKRRYTASIKKAILQETGSRMTLSQRAELDTFFKEIRKGFTKKDIAVTEKDILSREELKDIIRLSGCKTGLILQALYHSACRVSELVSMEHDKCEIRGNVVYIEITGKGNFKGTVQLPTKLYTEIKKVYSGKKYLFENMGRPLNRSTIYRMIKQSGKHIHRSDITPHTLRHTWASLNIEKLGLVKVSKYLRHKQVQTTANFYLHGRASMEEIYALNIETLEI